MSTISSYLLDLNKCSLLLLHVTMGFPTTGRTNGEESHQLGETDNELVCNSGKTKHLLFLTDRILKKQNLKVKVVVLPEVPLRTLLWLWLLLRRWHAHLFHFTPWPVIWLISWNRGWFILCLYWTGQWNWWYTEFGLCPHTDRLCLYLDS